VETYGTTRQATDKNKIGIWRMRFFCWITKATDTGAEYAVIFSLPMQQWLGERASMPHLYVGYITSRIKSVWRKASMYTAE